MKSEDQLQTWQKSKWAQILALLLGVLPAYLVPLYFTLRDRNAAFEPRSMLFYTIVWGGLMSLLMLLILRFLNAESIKDLNLKQGKWWKDILSGIGLMVITLGTFMLTQNFI